MNNYPIHKRDLRSLRLAKAVADTNDAQKEAPFDPRPLTMRDRVYKAILQRKDFAVCSEKIDSHSEMQDFIRNRKVYKRMQLPLLLYFEVYGYFSWLTGRGMRGGEKISQGFYKFLEDAVMQYGLSFQEAAAVYSIVGQSHHYFPLLSQTKETCESIFQLDQKIYSNPSFKTLNSKIAREIAARKTIQSRDIFFKNLENGLQKLQKACPTTETMYRGIRSSLVSNEHFNECTRAGDLIDVPILFFSPVFDDAYKYSRKEILCAPKMLILENSNTPDLMKYFLDKTHTIETLAPSGKLKITQTIFFPHKSPLLTDAEYSNLVKLLEQAQQTGSLEDFDWEKYRYNIGIIFKAQRVEEGDDADAIPVKATKIYSNAETFKQEVMTPLEAHGFGKNINDWREYYANDRAVKL